MATYRCNSKIVKYSTIMFDELFTKIIHSRNFVNIYFSLSLFNLSDFRMIQNTPAFTADEQPSIAIITLLYNEKMAVDAMMDIKKTYVQHKPKGSAYILQISSDDEI